MNSLHLTFHPTDGDLFGRSKWWGAPDLPKSSPYPTIPMSDGDDRWDEPLTFLCQVRCEELAPLDAEGWLPHTGMLYFFAAIDYFLGEGDLLQASMGRWPEECVRVMYSPSCDDLEPYRLCWEGSDESVFRQPEALVFSAAPPRAAEFKLLGRPYYEEICDECPDCLSLLQLDEEDRWPLRFYDCGMLCLLIRPDDLRARRWERVFAFLHSS